MLRYNLALELLDEYGMEATANLVNKATTSKAGIKRVNRKPRILSVSLPVSNYNKRSSDIERGY